MKSFQCCTLGFVAIMATCSSITESEPKNGNVSKRPKRPDMEELDQPIKMDDVHRANIERAIGRPIAQLQDMMVSIFLKIDEDKDNKLNEHEVKNWMHQINTAETEYEALIELTHIDQNNDKKVSWDEVVAAMKESNYPLDPKTEQLLRKRVEIADVDKDGSLDSHEMSYLLNPGSLPTMAEAEAMDIMELRDTNKDNKLTVDEFVGSDADTTDADREELVVQFNTHNLDGDDYLTLDELKKAYEEPRSAETKETIEILFADRDRVTLADYLKEWPKFITTGLTLEGKLLRNPENYSLIEFTDEKNIDKLGDPDAIPNMGDYDEDEDDDDDIRAIPDKDEL